MEALSLTPESQRTVVLLYYMGERSYAEIAAFLGVSTNVVKTRLYTAREKLRRQLGQIEEGLRENRPSENQEFAARVLSTALQLQLYTVNGSGEKTPAGSTVASRLAEAPSTGAWLIEPRQQLSGDDWNAVLGLVEEMRISGFGAEKQITDQVLSRIGELDHLTYLDLSGCVGVTDVGVRSLTRLPRLEHLNLSGTSVTDEGLSVLSHLTRLKSFHMHHQRSVTDRGLANLSACHELEVVDLLGTPAGDGAIRALSGKKNLREFLAGSETTDEGISLFHQFPAFKTWRGGNVEMSLLSARAHPTYLWLNLKSPITDAGLANLIGLDGLFAINIFGGKSGAFDAAGSGVTAAGLRSLARLPHLGWLGCCSDLCDDEAMRHISQMPGLRFLMCQDAAAGDDGFSALSRSNSIEYIWGRRCYNLGMNGFSALAAMPALRGLSVSCKNVDDAGLASLPQFPALTEFMPMDVPDEGFRHVGCCQRLEKLYCMYCTDTTDDATEHLSQLPALKSYQAWSSRITDRSLEVLSHIRTLEHVLLENCKGVSDAGLHALSRLPRLSQIDLEGLSRVSPAGTDVFPTTVTVNYAP